MEQSRRKKVAALGGGVVKEPKSQGSNPLARELEGLPPARSPADRQGAADYAYKDHRRTPTRRVTSATGEIGTGA